MLSRFSNFLFQPTDIAALVFFRIMFGILAFADLIGTWIYYHLEKDAFNPNNFQFRYYGFEWVPSFPEPLMSIFFIVLLFVCLFISLGLWYKWCTPILFLGFGYTYVLEKAHYLNHGYLFCWICLVMIFLPANKAFSMDVLFNPKIRQKVIPRWPIFLLVFMMGIVYFFGGIAKINEDWLIGMPMRMWMKNKANIPILGPFLEKDITAYFMSYMGLLLDLTVAFFLLIRRTRLVAFIFVVLFHTLNLIIFSIGIFPAMSISLSLMFFAPDFPRNIINWLRKRSSFIDRIEAWWQRQLESRDAQATGPDNYWQNAVQWRPVITLSIFLICLTHILLPLRHHLFPGNVAWTEEGHRYAWRMMLRSKHGYGQFVVVKPDGSKDRIKPGDVLGAKQKRKLFTHPDMILQFAHHLRDKYAEEGMEVEVYAEIKAKLNHRKYQAYIQPDVDLAKVEWEMFKSSDWIVPFEPDNK